MRWKPSGEQLALAIDCAVARVPFECAAGLMLGKIELGVSWWLGDWWAFGEHRYGDRKALVESEDWEGPGFQACVDAGTVAKSFESTRRRVPLSFSHHREVASFSPEEQDRLLDR